MRIVFPIAIRASLLSSRSSFSWLQLSSLLYFVQLHPILTQHASWREYTKPHEFPVSLICTYKKSWEFTTRGNGQCWPLAITVGITSLVMVIMTLIIVIIIIIIIIIYLIMYRVSMFLHLSVPKVLIFPSQILFLVLLSHSNFYYLQ